MLFHVLGSSDLIYMSSDVGIESIIYLYVIKKVCYFQGGPERPKEGNV